MASGRFESESEMVTEAFKLLALRERKLKLVQKGFEDIERGDYLDFDDEGLAKFFDDTKRRGSRAIAVGGQDRCMKSYRLSRQASYDIVEIWTHIGKDSPSAADRFVLLNPLRLTFQQLAIRRDERRAIHRFADAKDVWRITDGNYLIYHRRVGRVTEILRIVHGASLSKDLTLNRRE